MDKAVPGRRVPNTCCIQVATQSPANNSALQETVPLLMELSALCERLILHSFGKCITYATKEKSRLL